MPGEIDSAMSCMNREYACTHGYYFLAASRPDFDLVPILSAQPVMNTSLRKDLAGVCSSPEYARSRGSLSANDPQHLLRAKTWCKVAQLQYVVRHAPMCHVVVWLDADALLKPSRRALHQHPAVREWLRSPSVLAAPLEPPGVNPWKRGYRNNLNNTRITTGFMLLKSRALSSGASARVLNTWWHAADLRRGLRGRLGEPLEIYRSEWPMEQRVLDDYVFPHFESSTTSPLPSPLPSGAGGRRPVGPLLSVLGSASDEFNQPTGSHIAHYWGKGANAALFQPIIDANRLNACQRKNCAIFECFADATWSGSCIDHRSCPLERRVADVGECTQLCRNSTKPCAAIIHNRYGECYLKRIGGSYRADDRKHHTLTCRKTSSEELEARCRGAVLPSRRIW